MIYKVLIIVTLLSIASSFGECTTDGLYVNEPYVKELDSTTFDAYIHSKENSTANLVQFYSDTSSMSRDYTRTYLNISTETRNWRSIVKLSAVNCKNSINAELCLKNGFWREPVLKYFQRTSKIGDEGRRLTTYAHPQRMFKQLIAQISQEYRNNEYKDWPNFNVLPDFFSNSSINMKDLWGMSGRNCTDNFLLVLVDSPSQIDGISMLIKTHTIVGEEYPVRRVVRDNLLFKQLEELVTQYPSVLLAKRKIDVMNCNKINAANPTLNYWEVLGKLGLGSNPKDVKEIPVGSDSIYYQKK